MASFAPPPRRPTRPSRPRIDPLVGEIAEVLLTLGGAAHREEVIARLGARRGGRGDLDLRARAVAAFDAHSRTDGELGGGRPLFRRPFGAGDHRWALTAEAAAFLRAGQNRRAAE